LNLYGLVFWRHRQDGTPAIEPASEGETVVEADFSSSARERLDQLLAELRRQSRSDPLISVEIERRNFTA
jgi:hypothetical protein